MFNVWWGALFVVVNFSLFLLCYRLFGRSGLYAWMAMATVIANIQVVKTIELFGFVMTLGNSVYGTLFLVTDLLNERYGERSARRAVAIGFFALLASMATMQMALRFQPFEGDIAQSSLEGIFGLLPQIALGSITAYLVSQFLDVKLFAVLRRRYAGKSQLWIRSIGSTVVSQLVDTVIFCAIAFAGVGYSFDVWLQIVVTTYAIKLFVSVASTPIIYWARNFRVKDEPEAVQN